MELDTLAFNTSNNIAIILSKSAIIINFKILVKFTANLRLFCGYFTLSVYLAHKKCTELRIFEVGAKIHIILYARNIITNLLNKAIQKYLEFH